MYFDRDFSDIIYIKTSITRFRPLRPIAITIGDQLLFSRASGGKGDFPPLPMPAGFIQSNVVSKSKFVPGQASVVSIHMS